MAAPNEKALGVVAVEPASLLHGRMQPRTLPPSPFLVGFEGPVSQQVQAQLPQQNRHHQPCMHHLTALIGRPQGSFSFEERNRRGLYMKEDYI